MIERTRILARAPLTHDEGFRQGSWEKDNRTGGYYSEQNTNPDSLCGMINSAYGHEEENEEEAITVQENCRT
jgi:hypothetical protein